MLTSAIEGVLCRLILSLPLCRSTYLLHIALALSFSLYKNLSIFKRANKEMKLYVVVVVVDDACVCVYMERE